MSASTLIPISEYLATTYHPDREYVDGHLLERNVGEVNHSWLQGEIILHFSQYRKPLGLFAFPELRVQVKPTRFRIPDVTVVRGFPNEQIITEPPFLCIEVLSPDDTMTSMQEKLDDYLVFGIENIWIIDPRRKRGSWADSVGIHEANDGVLHCLGAPVNMDLTGMWPAA